MKQHIEAMVDRNVYDHIIVHSGTNDVDRLRVNDIAMNMESYVITLKRRWPNAQIALIVWSHICPQGRQHKN